MDENEEQLPKECCAECRFFHLYAINAGQDYLGQSCRRYPPLHFLGWKGGAAQPPPKHPERHYWLWVFPEVAANHWCGEFSARKGDPIMDLPLYQTSLAFRCQQVLERNGINTIGQLVSRSADELSSIPGFGKTSIRQVLKMLKNHGLLLAGDAETGNPAS